MMICVAAHIKGKLREAEVGLAQGKTIPEGERGDTASAHRVTQLERAGAKRAGRASQRKSLHALGEDLHRSGETVRGACQSESNRVCGDRIHVDAHLAAPGRVLDLALEDLQHQAHSGRDNVGSQFGRRSAVDGVVLRDDRCPGRRTEHERTAAPGGDGDRLIRGGRITDRQRLQRGLLVEIERRTRPQVDPQLGNTTGHEKPC